MSRPTYNAVLQYAKAKPAIIFAPTRRHAQSIATDLMMYTSGDGAPSRFLKVPTDVLQPFVEKLTDTAAATCAQVGIGLLHESMSDSDKATIGHLFQQNAIQVLSLFFAQCYGRFACLGSCFEAHMLVEGSQVDRIISDFFGSKC